MTRAVLNGLAVSGTVGVDGKADAAQVTIQGHSTQTNPLLELQNSSAQWAARLRTYDGDTSQGALEFFTHASEGPWRILRGTILDGGSARDHRLHFSYNRKIDAGSDVPDVSARASGGLTLEAEYNGLFEMNVDVRAPAAASGAYNRALSLIYNYSTTSAQFDIGYTYGSGLRVTGGTGIGTVAVRADAGQASTDPILRFLRPDDTCFWKVHPDRAYMAFGSSGDGGAIGAQDVTATAFDGGFSFYGYPNVVLDLGIIDDNSSPIAVRRSRIGVQDADYRLLVKGNGLMLWGDGAAAGDTNLFRRAASVLATNDEFQADINIRAQSQGAELALIGSHALTNDKAGLLLGSAGDTNLYRSAANTLRTNDEFQADLDIRARSQGAESVFIGNHALTSSKAGLLFGSAGDTNLYRSAADTLKTDDLFDASVAGIRTRHMSTTVPTGGNSGEVRVGTNTLWMQDAGTWKSLSPTFASAAKWMTD